MKKLTILLMVVLFLLANPVLTKAGINFYYQTEIFTKYPWRNLIYEGGSTNYVELSIGNFGLGVFQYSIYEGKNWKKVTNDEMDFLLSYYFAIPSIEGSIILSEYNLPSYPGKKWFYSWDIGFSVGFIDAPLKPTLEYYYDFSEYNGSDYLGATAHCPPLWNIKIDFGVGLNDGMWIEDGRAIYGLNASISRNFNIFGINIETKIFNIYLEEEGNNIGFILKISN